MTICYKRNDFNSTEGLGFKPVEDLYKMPTLTILSQPHVYHDSYAVCTSFQ